MLIQYVERSKDVQKQKKIYGQIFYTKTNGNVCVFYQAVFE